MTAIFLSGGGNEMQSMELDKKFYDSLRHKSILYIPLAMSKNKYQSCKEWITKVFTAFGSVAITMVNTFEDLSKLDFDVFGGIYIGGGNTFELMKGLRQHNIVEKIQQYSGSIYGGSAGAIVLGSSITTATVLDENHGVTNLNGMNQINGISIACHFKQHMLNQLLELHTNIIALPEAGGVFWDGQKLQLVGTETIWIIHNGTAREYQSHAYISCSDLSL